MRLLLVKAHHILLAFGLELLLEYLFVEGVPPQSFALLTLVQLDHFNAFDGVRRARELLEVISPFYDLIDFGGEELMENRIHNDIKNDHSRIQECNSKVKLWTND